MSNLKERKVKTSKRNNGEEDLPNSQQNVVADNLGLGPDGDTVHKEDKRLKKRSKTKIDVAEQKGSFLYAAFGKLKYVFLLIFVPPFLNYASLQREQNELRPGGELYDIGWGQKLFLSCQGQGSPTIVLDAPTGLNSDVWTVVAERLAKVSKVCVYDRAGLGFSDRPMNSSQDPKEGTHKWQPFTVERMMDDLNRLLTTASQQPKPFILVGAELGAVIAQFYAHIYETDILGLVLVNPLPDDIFADGGWSRNWFDNTCPMYQSLQLGAAVGLTRLGLLAGLINQPITGPLVTDEVITRQKHFLCHPRHLSSVVDEHYFVNETLSQMKTLRNMKRIASNITVSVLTGNYYDEQMPQHLNKAWARAEQNLLSKHFPQAKHVVVNGADRHMMYRKPEPIIEAVTKIIRKWKKSQAAQPQAS